MEVSKKCISPRASANHHADDSLQKGGNAEQSHNNNSSHSTVVLRNKLNNTEIRPILNFPTPDNISSYAEYYESIMGSALNHPDVVQIFTQ